MATAPDFGFMKYDVRMLLHRMGGWCCGASDIDIDGNGLGHWMEDGNRLNWG